MISTNENFLFLHVPKTGGTSVAEALLPFADEVITTQKGHHDGDKNFGLQHPQYGTGKHTTLATYKRLLEPDVYESLFKFTILRNPWDRMISFYFSPHRCNVEWDRNRFAAFVQDQLPFRHYIDSTTWRRRISERLGRLSPGLVSKIRPLDAELDYVVRFEHLNEDFQSLCSHLDLPCDGLPVKHSSDREHYSNYYDSRLKRLVSKRFKEEIHFGKYSFDKNKKNK